MVVVSLPQEELSRLGIMYSKCCRIGGWFPCIGSSGSRAPKFVHECLCRIIISGPFPRN